MKLKQDDATPGQSNATDFNTNALVGEDADGEVKPTKFQTLMAEEEMKNKQGQAAKAEQVAPAIELEREPYEESKGYGCLGWYLLIMSWIMWVVTFPLSLIFSLKTIKEYERAVVFRFGKFKPGGDKGPGIIFLLPCVDNYMSIDIRVISFSISPQDILTNDSVLVTLEIVVYYRVVNATQSISKVGNPYTSTALISQTTARNIVANKTLNAIITQRVAVCREMKDALQEVTKMWGIQIERVEIRDLKLPEQLQKAMNSEVEAVTDAKAKLTAAEGEQRASVALLKASEVIGQSPTALQLRYLQTLNNIAAHRNSTIVFPVPVDVMPNCPNMPNCPAMPHTYK